VPVEFLSDEQAKAGSEGVPESVGAKTGDVGRGADGQDDLDEPGDRQRSALPVPKRAGLAAALVQPGRDPYASDLGQWDGADLVALAVQPYGASAGGERDVFDVQPRAFLFAGLVVARLERFPLLKTVSAWLLGSVNVVERWSQRVAERVAPEEIDFAAEVGVAYAAGGRARKDLQRVSVQPGAFGPGTYAVDLPLVLQALADAGEALLFLLRSPYFSNAVAAGSLLVALRAGRHQHVPEPGQPAPSATAAPLLSDAAPPTSERQALEFAFSSLRDRLTAAGIARDRADGVAYELLDELLKDAAGAGTFVEALSAVPDEGRHAKESAKDRSGKRGKRGRRTGRS
jgi:hypothetical protein